MDKFISGLPDHSPPLAPTLEEVLARVDRAIEDRRKKRRRLTQRMLGEKEEQ